MPNYITSKLLLAPNHWTLGTYEYVLCNNTQTNINVKRDGNMERIGFHRKVTKFIDLCKIFIQMIQSLHFSSLRHAWLTTFLGSSGLTTCSYLHIFVSIHL